MRNELKSLEYDVEISIGLYVCFKKMVQYNVSYLGKTKEFKISFDDDNAWYWFSERDQTWKKYRDWETDRKSTRLNSSHSGESRMPSSA